MPWQRRPDWLYLPHQFEGASASSVNYPCREENAAEGRSQLGGPVIAEAGQMREAGQEADVSRKSDAHEEMEELGGAASSSRNNDGPGADDFAAARTIRGRRSSPGAGGAEMIRSNEAGGAVPEIRGPPLEPGTRIQERKSVAQLRLEARNAHLKRSLEAHAERVAKKRGQGEARENQPTATERIEALRRRISARKTNKGEAEDQGREQGRVEAATAAICGDSEDRRGAAAGRDGEGGHGHTGDAEPETGTAPSANSSEGRNVLQKRHFVASCMESTRDDPAGEASGRSEKGVRVAEAAGDAASRVAWHAHPF